MPQDRLLYLRWVKSKRDLFIHRWFDGALWPGEVAAEDQYGVVHRQLLYLEHVFRRASDRIWNVLASASLLHIDNLGQDGKLITNVGLWDELDADVGATS